MAKSKKRMQRRRPRKSRVSRRSSNKPSIGKLISKGVMELISLVPGSSALSSLADLTFKAVGLTSVPPHNSYFIGAAEIHSLVSRAAINPVSIIAGSRDSVVFNAGKTIACQYQDCRVISITVKITPTNPEQARSGEWHLGLQPYFDAGDEASGQFEKDKIPTTNGLHHMYMSIAGSSSKPLSLTYRPRVSDGWAYAYKPLSTNVAEIAVYYRDTARDVWTAFKASDFSCAVVLSGTIELRTSPPTYGTGVPTYSTYCTDKLSGVGMFLVDRDDSRCYALENNGFSCVDDAGRCQIKGVIAGSDRYVME